MTASYLKRVQGVAAFTLIEVLVASAVLSIVMAILLGTLTTSMALWRNTEGKISADREGRAAHLLLAQDAAGAILTKNPQFWPRISNNRLQFLTTKPADYQRVISGDVGDVCLVEYAVDVDNHSFVRSFFGSKQTYDFLKNNSLPSAPASGADPQLLATNILVNMYDSVRGLGIYEEPLRTNFVILGPDFTPIAQPYSASNFPTAVEVNFGVADVDSIGNEDLLNNKDYKLRNAGFFSFRLGFPKPTQ